MPWRQDALFDYLTWLILFLGFAQNVLRDVILHIVGTRALVAAVARGEIHDLDVLLTKPNFTIIIIIYHRAAGCLTYPPKEEEKKKNKQEQ